MEVVSLRIDDVHELIMSSARIPSPKGYGYDKVTEVFITGPEGPYAESIRTIKTTQELAEYILDYFGE